MGSWGHDVIRSSNHQHYQGISRSSGVRLSRSLGYPYHQAIQVIRSSGHQVIRSSGHQVIGSSGHWVIRSSGHQVIGSSGHQVIRSLGPQPNSVWASDYVSRAFISKYGPRHKVVRKISELFVHHLIIGLRSLNIC